MTFKEANLDYLMDLSGGDASIINEMIQLFLEQTPKDMAQLKAHIEQQDWTGTHATAHFIKPTLAYMGAEQLRDEMQEIEQRAKMPEVDGANLATRFQKLAGRVDVLLEELRQYLAS